MITEYREHVIQRAEQKLPPLPLNVQQTEQLLALLVQPPAGEEEFLLNLIYRSKMQKYRL